MSHRQLFLLIFNFFQPHLIQSLSDLKGPGDDVICPEQLNVLTGLVFEEGGEPLLELPFVCWSKSNSLTGCGDG